MPPILKANKTKIAAAITAAIVAGLSALLASLDVPPETIEWITSLFS
jgi:hypothetical protein